MQTIRNRHAESLRETVVSYAHATEVPALDENAIAARRETLAATTHAPRRLLLRTAALAVAAALAVFLAVRAPAVVAGMQRVFAAFTVAHGQTTPMTVREVGLVEARADVPFEIIAPPSLPGTTTTLRELTSPVAPASDSVVFDVHVQRPRIDVAIVETGVGRGPHQMIVSASEPDRGDTADAPLHALPKLAGGAGGRITLSGNFGRGSFVPLTWVTRGTRIVLMSPPGVLSKTQIHSIRSKMS